jgi:hypothetical protein
MRTVTCPKTYDLRLGTILTAISSTFETYTTQTIFVGGRLDQTVQSWRSVRFPTPAPTIRKTRVDSAALAHLHSSICVQIGRDLRPFCVQLSINHSNSLL